LRSRRWRRPGGGSNSDDSGGGGGEQQVVVIHTRTHGTTHTRSLPESDMITINRSVASIVAAECIQFLITGRRNSSKQDGTPSAVRSRIARLVAKFSDEIFQRRRLSDHLHPHLKRTRRRA